MAGETMLLTRITDELVRLESGAKSNWNQELRLVINKVSYLVVEAEPEGPSQIFLAFRSFERGLI